SPPPSSAGSSPASAFSPGVPVSVSVTSVPAAVVQGVVPSAVAGLGAPVSVSSVSPVVVNSVTSSSVGQVSATAGQVAPPAGAYWFYSPQLATSTTGGNPLTPQSLQQGAPHQGLHGHSLPTVTAAAAAATSPPPVTPHGQPGNKLTGTASLMATMTSLANVKDSRWLQLEANWLRTGACLPGICTSGVVLKLAILFLFAFDTLNLGISDSFPASSLYPKATGVVREVRCAENFREINVRDPILSASLLILPPTSRYKMAASSLATTQ
ncbi:muscleblind protein 3-like, partial [Tropilaelaps mercedesae]